MNWKHPKALLLTHGMAFLLSVLLHLSVGAPFMAQAWQTLEESGEEGTSEGAIGDGGEPDEVVAAQTVIPATPIQVSMFRAPGGVEPIAENKGPASTKPQVKSQPQEQSSAKTTPRNTITKKTGTVAGKKRKGKKKRCDPVDEVVKVNDTQWRVQRSFMDWYATHLRELEKQVGVGVHKDKTGKRDGARLYLPRCSVLKQAGFKNGDIVRSINGKKVYTIPKAVTTYLKVRNDKVITIVLTRKNGENRTHRYRLKT